MLRLQVNSRVPDGGIDSVLCLFYGTGKISYADDLRETVFDIGLAPDEETFRPEYPRSVYFCQHFKAPLKVIFHGRVVRKDGNRGKMVCRSRINRN